MTDSSGVHPIRLLPRNPLARQVQEFLLDREARGLSPRTVEWYGEQLAHLKACCQAQGVHDAEQLEPAFLRALLVDFAKTHNPGGTHGLYRALRAFLNWHATEYDRASNPIDKVHPPKVAERPMEPVSLADLRKMLATCERRTFHGDRDKAALLCLLDSGCRRAEFLALNVGDVDLGTGAVLVQRGKGGKARATFLGAHSRKAVARYLRHRLDAASEDPLWTTAEGERLKPSALRAMLKRRAKDAGVDAPCPHDFRRGFALASLRAGMDLVSLQRLLGHSDLSVIHRYLAQSEADLRAAHERASPVDRLRL